MEYSSALDEKDLQILTLLQWDCSISNVDVAKQVDLSPPSVHSRIKRLRKLGYIEELVALLNPEKLGFQMQCFILVILQIHDSEQVKNFHRHMQAIPEVMECHHITGEYDYLLKVMVRNQQELQKLLMDKLTPVEHIARMQTSLVLTTIKDTTRLPITGEA